jgi:hypothetical protein
LAGIQMTVHFSQQSRSLSISRLGLKLLRLRIIRGHLECALSRLYCLLVIMRLDGRPSLINGLCHVR